MLYKFNKLKICRYYPSMYKFFFKAIFFLWTLWRTLQRTSSKPQFHIFVKSRKQNIIILSEIIQSNSEIFCLCNFEELATIQYLSVTMSIFRTNNQIYPVISFLNCKVFFFPMDPYKNIKELILNYHFLFKLKLTFKNNFFSRTRHQPKRTIVLCLQAVSLRRMYKNIFFLFYFCSCLIQIFD